MRKCFASLVLVLSVLLFSDRVLGQTDTDIPVRAIGQIFISGNTTTKQEVILKAVNLYPGQILRRADLRKAEKNLERLGLFAMDPVSGLRPTVSIIDPEGPCHFKDILVNVQETNTSRVRLIPGLSLDGGVVISVVWEERNFDPFQWPTDLDDLLEGGAFRGAGKLIRVELAQLPLVPLRFPRFLQLGGRFIPVEFPGVLKNMGKQRS